MAALIAQPARIPLVDPQTGLITREWQRYFTGLYQRVGGAQGDSTTDLSESAFDDAGTEEQEMALYALGDTIGQIPVMQAGEHQSHLETEVCQLREEVALLRQQINDIQQGTTQ